jgi:hypothetical protein
MGNHKAEPIMKIIDASAKLLAMWNKLNLQMQKNLLNEFYIGMGVNLPDAIEAYIRELNVRVQFATNTDLSDFTKGITSVVEDSLAEDYPKLALDVISLATDFVTQALGSGSLKAGVQSTSMKSIIKNPSNPNDEITFVTAIYAVTVECEASQWFTKSNFYATKFAFVVWTPKKNELVLMPKMDIQ